MLKFRLFLLAILCSFTTLSAGSIKHRFLAVDESRSQLHYVDQNNPENDWTFKLPGRFRDIQLIGSNQVLLSSGNGYAVYDLKTKKLVKKLKNKQFKGTTSVRRLENGHTLIGCNQKGITLFELNTNDKIIKTANYPKLRTMRLMRLTKKGTLLFGSNDKEVVEADVDGKIHSRTPIKGCRHIYHILRKDNGNLLIASGYGAFVAETDPKGKIIRKTGSKEVMKGIHTLFYAGMQILENGNTVVCNWTGHGAKDSEKAPQLLEFDKGGKLVWSWHDAKKAGTIHGVIILDKLDTGILHDDSSVVLRPVKSKAAYRNAKSALELAEKTLEYVSKSVKLNKATKKLKAYREKFNTGTDFAALEKELKAFRRSILFKHPDLQFKNLLINKRPLHPPGYYWHMIDHYLGAHSGPGDGLAILSNWKETPQEKLLLKGKLPVGDTRHPDLSYDGNKILFSYCKQNKEDNWKQQFFIYEINVDGTGLRQITGTANDPQIGKYGRKTQIIEDFDPCYLPDGGIVFISTRIQGHVRCAYGSRYCPTFSMYRMNYDGSGIRQLSYGDIAEYDPSVLPDGRIVYTRWEYTDRHDTFFQGLWTMRPDGTGTAHYYGNYSVSPNVVTEAQAIPGTKQVIANATAHHYFYIGSIIKVDPEKGEDGHEPLTRMTPEVPFPETNEGNPRVGRYAMPYPVNDRLYFVSYLEKETGQTAVYLMDDMGGKEFIYRAQGTSCYAPIPIRPRKRPPVIPSTLNTAMGDNGVFYIQNVYESRQPIPKGKVKYLRINQIFDQPIDVAPKVGIVQGMTPYKILGEVPVNTDGSVAFKAPAGEPLQLQLLDENRMCIMSMRTFIYLQAGEVSSCIGCHEDKKTAVAMRKQRKMVVHDLTAPKSSDYKGGFNFAASVQPVLDRHCISCHGLGKAKKVNLLGTEKVVDRGPYGKPKELIASEAYLNLIKYTKPAHRNKQTNFSVPKDYYSHASKLAPMLLKGHKDVKLAPDEWHAIVSWLDLNVPMNGSWSWNQPQLRKTNPEGEKQLRAYIKKLFGEKVASQPLAALINIGALEKSRILMAPLSKRAGGWEQLSPLWSSRKHKEYQKMKSLIQNTIVPYTIKEINATCGKEGPVKNRNACKCGNCWIRLKHKK